MFRGQETIHDLICGLQTSPLPPPRQRTSDIAHAPTRVHNLSEDECRLAVENALRYFPPESHADLAPEFAQELKDFGHIYMYRLFICIALL